ncbi:MAG: hypothetical protein LBB53_00060 [Prevotellaceae bacterium]|jgi:hypothetical protein|nr:hypothetical protein [Prevotellaceae bacterium]
MKKILKLKESGLFMFALMLLCAVFGISGADFMTAEAIVAAGNPPAEYGDQILDENGVVIDGLVDLTDAITMAPELISKHYEQEVISLNPYDTPTMSLMRSKLLSNSEHWRKKKKVSDHIIQINRYKTPPVQISVNTATALSSTLTQLPVDFGQANGIIGIHQTIIFKSVDGYKEDGQTLDGYNLICRVVAKDEATGFPVLKPINGKKSGNIITLPALAAGTQALRSDRIGTETQIRTEQFGIAPSPTDYYVPKKLIEFGTSGWYDNATKTIKWGDNEIKKAAMTEFLRTSAPNFWLGKQTRAIFPEYKSKAPELTFFPEGLFYQASRALDLNGTVNIAALVNLKKIAFGDNNSGPVKVFAMGDELSPLFQELILNTPGLNYSVYHSKRLNIDFSEIMFAGGKRIWFIDDPSLDDCGLNDKGFILDPQYAATYSYLHEILPFDEKKKNERDITGMTVIDESVNVLLNHDANVVVTL